MSIALETALISAAVALLTGALGFLVTLYQSRRERNKWLIELKTSYSQELFKARLAHYPRIFEVLGKLSIHESELLSPEKAHQLGCEIHTWLYSPGGLVAESLTRGTLKELRRACLTWKQGEKPADIRDWRHQALLLLRQDLDIKGFESFDTKDDKALLERVKADMARYQ